MRSSLLDRLDRLEHEIGHLREEKRQSGARAARLRRNRMPPMTPPRASVPPASVPHAFPPRETAPRETEPFRPPPQPRGTAGRSHAASRETSRFHQGLHGKRRIGKKFIGENLISKIGIGVLVLAIGFFVKYAIDNDWIGPIGRVGVGLLCGGVLVGLAHWLRNQYAAFSSVLVGGGLAVFYFTIALAYHQYHLFGQTEATRQTAAFIIMLVITAFSVVLSLLYNREELAIIALVGGFITPFLVSNGSGDYKVLFTYLLILNTGLLVIAYNKAWRLLNGLAFAFTAVLFSIWLIRLPYNADQAVYYGGAAFATAFYILFSSIAHTIRENKKFIGSGFCDPAAEYLSVFRSVPLFSFPVGPRAL